MSDTTSATAQERAADTPITPEWAAVMEVLEAAYDLGMSGDPVETRDPEQIQRRLRLVNACEAASTRFDALVAEGERMRGFQAEVGTWGEETFPESTPQTIVRHLRREADELLSAVENCRDGTCLTVYEEAADNALMLLHLAHRGGFDLMTAAREKFEHVKANYVFGPPDHEGVREHIRTPAPPAASSEEGTEDE